MVFWERVDIHLNHRQAPAQRRVHLVLRQHGQRLAEGKGHAGPGRTAGNQVGLVGWVGARSRQAAIVVPKYTAPTRSQPAALATVDPQARSAQGSRSASDMPGRNDLLTEMKIIFWGM